VEKTKCNLKSGFKITEEMSEKIYIIPPGRTRYLSEISESSRNYDKWAEIQSDIAEKLQGIQTAITTIKNYLLTYGTLLLKGRYGAEK
jgi:methylmalonyl-CoA mutase